jgi:hypothetical protein
MELTPAGRGWNDGDISEAMQRVDRAAGKILDRNKMYGGAILCDTESKEHDELLRASLSLLNKIRRTDVASVHFISCAVCLNLKGLRCQADTVVKGYSVCDEHVELVSNPNFNIATLKPQDKKNT